VVFAIRKSNPFGTPNGSEEHALSGPESKLEYAVGKPRRMPLGLGSTPVSGVGFGVSPKQPGKVRESETLSPTPETGVLPRWG